MANKKQTNQKNIKQSITTAPIKSMKTTFNRKEALTNWLEAWKKIELNYSFPSASRVNQNDLFKKLRVEGFSYSECTNILSSIVRKTRRQLLLLYLIYNTPYDNLGKMLTNDQHKTVSYLGFFIQKGLTSKHLIWMLSLPLEKIEIIKNLFLPLFDENKKLIKDACDEPLTGMTFLERSNIPFHYIMLTIVTGSPNKITAFLENLITKLTTPPIRLTIPFGLFSEIEQFSNYEAPFSPRTGTSM